METVYINTKDRLMSWLNKEYDTKFPVTAGNKPVSGKLQFVDLYNGQFELLKAKDGHTLLPFKFPAVLIEYFDLQCQTRLGTQRQQVNGIMRMHIGQQCYADSYMMGVPARNANNQSLALNTLIYLKQVHRTMQGFKKDDMCQPFNRTGIGQDVNHNSIIVHTMDYEFAYIDNSADPTITWREMQLDALVTADKSILNL